MNNSYPTGTVTFLFTDIEGSTKLAQGHPDAIPALLARHNEILNQAIELHNGYVFQVVGDSFAVAFHTASDALNAAVGAQRLLHTEPWSPSPIKVRMGLHTGFAESHEGGYRGYLTMARVQRVMSCGHGGQILLSFDMSDQVREQLPQGVGLRDLGLHYLKGITQAEHLFQLVTDDLPANFPALKSTPVVPSMRKEVFSLLDHIVRGQLVGRESEMSELEGFWNRAERGEGHLVLLSGEPGVGKTRLVEELIALATLRGALVLEGHFHPELGVTYLGLREALQDYLRSLPADQARAAIGSTAPELVKLVPEVEAIVGNITPNPPMGELEVERLRLFDHVTQFLIRLTKKTPMLFVLEDLHWADGPSLLFLHFLLRNTRQVPILVLGTYRETELDSVRPFYETLLGLNRDRLYTRVALRGLEAKNVEKLVSSLLDGAVDASLITAITRDTEGNPFFIEEVVKGLVERNGLRQEGGVWKPVEEVEHFIPQSIQIALGKRLETLSEDARAALSLASILGREFDIDVLLGMSEWDEDRMLDALDEAVKARLITEMRLHGKETYRFAHALLAQVIYNAINTRRRARFHQQAGESLERVYARKLDEQVEALAYHFARASSNAADKAVTYGLRAAEKAVAVYAHDQAIQHLQIALDLIEVGEQNETRLVILEKLADVHRLRGERTEAIQIYQDALNTWHDLVDADKWTAVRLYRKIGETFNLMAKKVDIEQFKTIVLSGLESALTLIEGELPHPESVRLLTALGNYGYWSTYQPYVKTDALSDKGEYYTRAAVAMAEQLDAPVELSAALAVLADVYSTQGLLRERAQIALQRLELSRDPRFADQREQISVLYQAGTALCAVGDYVQALTHLREVERLADAIRDSSQVISALNLQIQCFFGLDRWDEILQVEEKRMALEASYGSDRIGRMCFQCGVSAYVHGWRGELELARARRVEAYNMMADNFGALESWPAIGHY